MHRKSLCPTQEQAFFIVADAVQEGRLAMLLTANEPTIDGNNAHRTISDMPPIHSDIPTRRQTAIAETQKAHLERLWSNDTAQAIARSQGISESAVGKTNARLQAAYGATSPEQMMRLAIEHEDLPIELTAPKSPCILGAFHERQLAIGGLLSHGLSVNDLAITLGVSQRTVGKYLQSWRNNLGAVNNVSAVAMSLKLGLMEREGTWPLRTRRGKHRPVVRPLGRVGLLPRIRALFQPNASLTY